MKLQSQLSDAELAQMHANVIENHGGIPEPKWIRGPDNKDYRSYTALKKANPGMPSTEQVYRDMVLKEPRKTSGQCNGPCSDDIFSTSYKAGILTSTASVSLGPWMTEKEHKLIMGGIPKITNCRIEPVEKPDYQDMVGKTYHMKALNRYCTVTAVEMVGHDWYWVEYIYPNGVKSDSPVKLFLADWKLHEPKLPEFGYDITVGNFIAMDKFGVWAQYDHKPIKTESGWSMGCYVTHTAENNTESVPLWSESLYQMTSSGLVHVET